jgi:uncharacterized phage protein (TIGR02216 family)
MRPSGPRNEGLRVADLMALGLGRLKLTPEVFWRMTLPELMAAAGALDRAAPALRRRDLEGLIRQYPDDDGGQA